MSLDSKAFKPCVVIPCYNHGETLGAVLTRLSELGLACFVVDDGSDAATQQQLKRLVEMFKNLTLLRFPQNQGKGAAVLAGFQSAAQAGYTHALQVDADGQHNLDDVTALLAEAQRYPNALISGQPIYDDSIPRSRRYGRWVTHIWVWIETLSFSLKDSMCGYRVYPLAASLALAQYHCLGKRMDFDTEIMVRLYWQGHDSHFIPTRVTYPKNGISHFDVLRDNIRISWMHTRLFFGMLPRIPFLLWQRRRKHWAQTPEVKGLLGMRIMLTVYRLLGRQAFEWLLRPVVAAYWLTARQARRASQQWITQITRYAVEHRYPLPRLNSYAHFLRFGQSMLEKIAGWQGDLRLGKEVVFAPGAEETLAIGSGQGKILFASHLGDVEVCRALAEHATSQTITALVFHEHALRFKQIMDEVVPQAGIHLLPVTDIGPDTAIILHDRIQKGEWIAIVGDRIAVQPHRGGDWRVVWSSFMGRQAPFPEGPFILAAILRCPVNLLFALHQQGQLKIFCEPFANPLTLPRAQRKAALQEAVDRYAQRLQHYALLSPLDWFNFYDFWHLPQRSSVTEKTGASRDI